MEMITPNVYTETKIRGCNPSIVFTSEGSVFIDTAQWLSTLLEMREFAKKRGPIRYLINTEAHIDHIFGNHWFAGESLVVGHENLKNIFWTVADDKPCYEYSVDVLERQDALQGRLYRQLSPDYLQRPHDPESGRHGFLPVLHSGTF